MVIEEVFFICGFMSDVLELLEINMTMMKKKAKIHKVNLSRFLSDAPFLTEGER